MLSLDQPQARLAALAPLRRILESIPEAPLLLALRIGAALVFWRSGLTKVVTNEAGNFPAFPPMLAGGTVDLFASEYKLPLLPPDFAASLAATGELVASALLILGLAARLSAAGLLAMAAVIQVFVYPGNWPEHLLWASALAFVISRGPGAISLDRLIWGR